MARRSLRPNLNQIRAWVRQGRTDAWIAHQLDVSVRDIEQFKRQNELVSDEDAPRSRARRRRGGRGRRLLGDRSAARNAGPLEGTFDHGEEGYGLWLDPAIQENPIYAEHWAGHRPVEVDVEEDRIVIRRVGEDD